MIFTSIAFAVFFCVVTLVYHIWPPKSRWIWLLFASVYFYMYISPVLILMPAALVVVTWFTGLQIEKRSTGKNWKPFYLVTIFLIVGALVFFKYADFFTSSITDCINYFRQQVLHLPTTVHNPLLVNVISPLGISYISFQAIGYLVEIKRGTQPAEKNFWHLATFLLFFPKIVAGPVERAHNFLPQLKQPKRFVYADFSAGSKLLLWGLFKKLVIADRLSIFVNAVLDNASHHSGISIVMAVLFYAFQLYADFSGYTDMALGIAKIFGFNLMPNFRRPMLAKSVTEFWRRWHMSLSTWFADYFYNPIAIAKRDWGKWAIVVASFATFITLGIWHGPNWTFVVFGALQGLALTIEFFTRKQRKKLRKQLPVSVNDLAGHAFTMLFFAFSLIFFRAGSVGAAIDIIKRIFVGGSLHLENVTIFLFSVAGIFFLFLTEMKKEYYNSLFTFSESRYWLVRNCYYCLLLTAILIAGVFDGGEFIYFQF